MFRNRRATKRLMIEINVLAKAQMAILDEIAVATRNTPPTKPTPEIDGLKRALNALQNVELQK